jgi:hypothetical protein
MALNILLNLLKNQVYNLNKSSKSSITSTIVKSNQSLVRIWLDLFVANCAFVMRM